MRCATMRLAWTPVHGHVIKPGKIKGEPVDRSCVQSTSQCLFARFSIVAHSLPCSCRPYTRNVCFSFARHYQTNESMPEALYAKLLAARNYRCAAVVFLGALPAAWDTLP